MVGTDALAERQGQVSEEYNSLDRAAELLAEHVARVEDRLGCVLREGDGKSRPEELGGELVPLANSLRTIWQRIERQVEKLDNILSRLEL